jgi:hypothetical protein
MVRVRRWIVLLAIVFGAFGLFVKRTVSRLKEDYPFGVSHCCIARRLWGTMVSEQKTVVVRSCLSGMEESNGFRATVGRLFFQSKWNCSGQEAPN